MESINKNMATRTPGVQIKEVPYYGYVYMWSDLKRNKFYVGSHKGSIYDNYKSGSKRINSIIKKRNHTMVQTILEYYYGDDRSELYSLEEKWLKFYNVEDNSNFYNYKSEAKGGCGPFKHKGKKRSEYTPNWVDDRLGKTLEEIYEKPDEVRTRLREARETYIKTHGHGWKKGKKHINDSRRGKTVEEIYGYRRLANPPRPFKVEVFYPDDQNDEIYCEHESDFYEKVKMESTNLQILKKEGIKIVKRRNKNCKHNFPVGTVLKIKFVN